MAKESQLTAREAFERVRRQRIASADYATRRRAEFAAGCSADLVLSVAQHCRDVIAALDAAAAVPGLVAYARLEYGDAGYDMAAEYQTLRAALVALRDAIVAVFPQDADGWLLYQKLTAGGTLTTRSFTPAQLASSLPLLDAVIAALA
jgi:hypothetical protein